MEGLFIILLMVGTALTGQGLAKAEANAQQQPESVQQADNSNEPVKHGFYQDDDLYQAYLVDQQK